MKTLRVLALAVAAAGLVTACKASRPVGATHEQPIATTFPHEKHGGFDCIDCHTGIPNAKALGQAKLPGVVKCQECHELDKMTPADRAAHTPPTRAPREYQMSFNHNDHLNRIKTKEINQACATCHKELPQPGVARDVTPPMQACTACHHHEEEVAAAKCQPCHVSLRRYPLKPIEALAAFSHQGNFIKEHKNIARNGAETCAQCHDQTYCANCHATSTVPFKNEIRFPERVEADFIHRGDFVSRHQIEAAADPASCRRCHGSYFCDSCHKVQNLSPRASNPLDPHPKGWAIPGSGEFHGTAARANIVACAGCHDQAQGSVCVNCHRSLGPNAAGIGGNPHPSDYASHHPRSDIAKNAMCRVCHTNG
jgi:hypothetical protein